MAEFCNRCAQKFGMIPDFDPDKKLKKLKNGHEVSVFCEGCAMVGLKKDVGGTLYVAHYKKGEVSWTQYFGPNDLV